MSRLRTIIKSGLALGSVLDRAPATGATLLIWHRVGGGTGDELDMPAGRFAQQLDLLLASGVDVLSLDAALDRLDAGDATPSVVLTFDDGFADVATIAQPLLAARRLPYTVYLAAGLVGGAMRWEGSSAESQGAPALTWEQALEIHQSGLVTFGNHTFDHSPPDDTDASQLDGCSDAIASELGEAARPRHFAWTWGIESLARRPLVEARFRSAATGSLGRNLPDGDRLALRRVPVRASDPPAFFAAKLRGGLRAERAYAGIVAAAKGARGLVRRG